MTNNLSPVRRGRDTERGSFADTPGTEWKVNTVPTPEKEDQVRQIRELIETSTVAIATNNNGLSVADMTELRRVLREQGVRLRVVKNTLAHIAADEAGAPAVKDIVTGPTGIAFGFDDPAAAAKALTQHLSSSRIPMTIIGGYLSGRTLTPQQVDDLANLPPKEVLVAQVLGQLQSPIAGLVGTLQAPLRNLAYVLNSQQVGLVTALKAIADQKDGGSE